MILLDIGFGNLVNADRIIAVTAADAAPAKRMISAAKEKNLAVDATCGRKTKSVIVMDSGHIILSAKETDRLARSAEKDEEQQ